MVIHALRYYIDDLWFHALLDQKAGVSHRMCQIRFRLEAQGSADQRSGTPAS